MFLFPINKRENTLSHGLFFGLIISALLFAQAAAAKKEELKIIVDTTYMSMHTGPGRGYPIFHVLEKGEIITLLYSKTDWIKALTAKGIKGWINRQFISNSIGINGEIIEIGTPQQEGFNHRRWEIGTTVGAFDNAIEVIGFNGAYRFTQHISAELRLSQATGRRSNSRLISWGLVHMPFPEWRLSPFFTVANGKIDISTNNNSTQEESKNTFFLVGTGFNLYLTRRFMARFEYNNYTSLANEDKNGNIDEWKVGMTAFF